MTSTDHMILAAIVVLAAVVVMVLAGAALAIRTGDTVGLTCVDGPNGRYECWLGR